MELAPLAAVLIAGSSGRPQTVLGNEEARNVRLVGTHDLAARTA